MIQRSCAVLLLLLTLILGACGGGSTTFVEPPPAPAGDLTLRVLPDLADQSTAIALGWATGILDAEVRLIPRGSTDSGVPLHTGADGTVLLAGVTQGDNGTYLYSAQRLRTGASGSGPYQWTRNSAADLYRRPKTAPR